MAKFSINLKDGSVKQEEEKDIIVGIDLGTTNSLVAYINEGQPEILRTPTASKALVPSIVHFDESGSVVVGDAAKEMLISAPERTIYSVKRLLGKSYTDISEIKDLLGYTIIDEDEDTLVKIKVGDRYYSPIELSAEILRELKRVAESRLEAKIEKAVITVPAYFNDSQRQATRDAGKLAGLDVLRIVNEPTAASLAYGIGTSREQAETIAVYDLGGGTFDISILEIQDGIFEVLATNGDTFLGGDDFDRAIIDYWMETYSIPAQLLEDKAFGQMIRLQAEEAKKTLSSSSEYSFSFENQEFSITKETFESIISPLVDKTLEICRRCIEDADIELSSIDQVVMVGGSTRVPLVKEVVAKLFKKEVNDTIDPDQVVALGAAVQADILAGNRKDMLLLDITPLSLGIETMGGLMDTIIPRNSKVPAKAGRQYTTSVDGQTKLKVAVYQGERDLVKDNRKLGEFVLSGIPPMAAGMPKIDIKFILDADGILRVKASETRSNVQTEVQIKSQYGISEEEMALMLKDSLVNAQQDMDQRALIEAQNEGKNVALHSEKFIEQNAAILSSEEVKTLKSHIGTLRSQIESGTKDDINGAMDALNAYSTPLAQRALDHNIAVALKGKDL